MISCHLVVYVHLLHTDNIIKFNDESDLQNILSIQTYVLLEGPTITKVVLRCTLEDNGALSVMTLGA